MKQTISRTQHQAGLTTATTVIISGAIVIILALAGIILNRIKNASATAAQPTTSVQDTGSTNAITSPSQSTTTQNTVQTPTTSVS